jgi:NAD(P)-dependent dehydrogenase (short-subunit alcohol dehydrogenase family)
VLANQCHVSFAAHAGSGADHEGQPWRRHLLVNLFHRGTFTDHESLVLARLIKFSLSQSISTMGSSVAYSVTKAAGLHLMKNFAFSQGPKIRVNAVLPGLLLTEWVRKF